MPIIKPRMLGLLPDDETKSTFWVADDSNVERKIFDTDGEVYNTDGTTLSSHVGSAGNPHNVVASQVGVTDSGSYFTGTNVETALQSVGAQLAQIAMRSKSSRLLSTMLRNNKSFGVVGIGDSTMTLASSWLCDVFTRIGAHWGYNVKHAQYNYGGMEYEAWSTHNNEGDDAHLRIVKSTAPLYTDCSGCVITSADLQIEVDLSMDNWTDHAGCYITGRSLNNGERGWGLYINGSFQPVLLWYPDGINASAATFNSISTGGYANNSRRWLKITLDVDDGAGRYVARCYTSTNGFTWTLGQTVTGGSITSIKNSLTERYYIGSAGGTTGFVGKIYEVRIRDGIGGKIVNPQPITVGWYQKETNANSAISIGGTPTIYVYNSAIGGFKESSYTDDISKKAMPNIPGAFVIESLGYNNANVAGYLHLTALTDLLTKIKTNLLYPSICLCSQLPTISPAEYRNDHLTRISQTASYAVANGYDLIPFSDVVAETGTDLSTILSVDGIHPNSAGYVLLADIAEDYFAVT